MEKIIFHSDDAADTASLLIMFISHLYNCVYFQTLIDEDIIGFWTIQFEWNHWIKYLIHYAAARNYQFHDLTMYRAWEFVW